MRTLLIGAVVLTALNLAVSGYAALLAKRAQDAAESVSTWRIEEMTSDAEDRLERIERKIDGIDRMVSPPTYAPVPTFPARKP